ncbi:MAG TPA: pre-peptidase C-terminal domain-containing protein, partial [bacterium]|nr:pre-peptidase C-terminal domain-containing protein [bacterium]
GDLGRSSDPYEPNDTTPYFLGSGTSYTITDAYLDPVDVLWTMDVVNDGGDVANSFDVGVHVGDKVLSTTLDGIGAGETRTVSFTSSDADAGTLTAWGEVDIRGDVNESDEQDNTTANVDVTVVADQDCFSVYQISGGTLSVTLDQLPADFDLELLDPSGTLVASSRNAGLTAESITFTATSSGNWIVRVVGYDGARSASFPYRLQIDAP